MPDHRCKEAAGLRSGALLRTLGLLACLQLLAAPSSAGTLPFIVGTGVGCTHATLAAAVAAAAANGSGDDTIRLAVPSVALTAKIDVVEHGVTIIGGYSSCGASSPTGRTTITLANGWDGFWVDGGASDYRTFYLSRVDVVSSGAAERPVRLIGLVAAVLEDSTLEGGNTTFWGANLYMEGPVILSVVSGSEIFGGDTSGDGGGIYCIDGGSLFVQTGSSIYNNAAANGAGIYADDCTVSLSSSSGAGNRVEVYGNGAELAGGGIAAYNGSSVTISGVWDATNNTAVLSANSSEGAGGGLYLNGSTATIRNAWFFNNGSSAGGGIFVSGAATLTMDVNPATCPHGRLCSWIDQNYETLLSGGIGGSGIAVAAGGTATVRQTKISGNKSNGGSPGSAAATTASGASLTFEGCEFHDNISGPSEPEVARVVAAAGSTLRIAFSTLVETTVTPGIGVIDSAAGATVRLLSSIVQADRTFDTGAAVGASSIIDCVIARETASFPIAGTFVTTVASAASLFTNPATDDYSLLSNSPAVDYCDDFNAVPTDTDIDNQRRGYNAAFANNIGPFDLGADEWTPTNLIFWDGFESGNPSSWSAAVL